MTKGHEKTPSSPSGHSGGKGAAAYTDPELRARIKAEIQAGDKGGRPGQWSARKSQLLVHEYEKQGGGYTSDERTPEQESLKQWEEEEWTTADGKPAERDGEMHRYLSREAWAKLTPEERKATDAKKLKGDSADIQFVANTAKAREARKEVSKAHDHD